MPLPARRASLNLLPLTAMVMMTMTGGAWAQQQLDGGSLNSLRYSFELKAAGAPARGGPSATPAPTGQGYRDSDANGASEVRPVAASEVPTDGGAATPLPGLLDAAQRAAANRAADAGVDAARAQAQQVWRQAWMPRLDASANRFQQKQTTTYRQAGGSQEYKTDGPASNVTFTASLPVWRASERASARAQAAVTEQSEWQARRQRANTARDVTLAYIGAAESNEQRRLAEAQQELLQTQLHINDRRLQAGMGTVLDQLETRTRLDQARASLQELVMRATSQRLVLERLSAQRVQLPAGFNPATARTPHGLPGLDEALALADQVNPDIRDARAAIEAARLTTHARDAEFWQPSIDAVASVAKNKAETSSAGIPPLNTTESTRNVGVQLSWPIFSGGVQQSRVKEASALLTQAQARLDDARGQVQANLRDAYQNLAQAQAIIAAQQDVEATATATFEAVRKAFVAGMRTNIDLLNAQQQIYSARQNVVAARVTALSAQVGILALLDRLDAEHVAPMTPHFDTQALPTPAQSSLNTTITSPAATGTPMPALTAASSLSPPKQSSR